MSTLTPDETILGLLAAQPQHGYQLMDTFEDPQRLGSVWKLSTSQLYAVLKRLERGALITGVEQYSENAPPRTEYRITDGGWHVLMTWLNDLTPSASVRRVRVECLSRLYIAQILHQPILPIIQRQRAACAAERARHAALLAAMPHGVGALAIELVITQLDAVLQWLDRCELSLSC